MEVVFTYFLKKKVLACEVLSAKTAATSNVSPDERGFRIGFCLKRRCYELFDRKKRWQLIVSDKTS